MGRNVVVSALRSSGRMLCDFFAFFERGDFVVPTWPLGNELK